ncbi:ATP-binding protein [Dehalococcoidia bacterium]|nr:ATP-binding protein [Dehalococcoidia bacterium]
MTSSGISSRSRVSEANKLLLQIEELEKDGQFEFWHSGNNTYVTYEVGNHRESWPVESETFKLRLSEISFNTSERVLPDVSKKDVINTLIAKARFNGAEYTASYRVVKYQGSIFIDLGDASWTSAKVTSEGWSTVRRCPVRFWRTEHSRALPVPQKGEGIEIFRRYINVSSESDLLLIIAFMVQALFPPGPYPVLSLSGEQGSAKSTAARLIVSLVDPKAAPLRPIPGNERDLMIDASQSLLLAFDNISHIKPNMSDALCRLSSGGGFSTRKLYKDSDQVIFEAQRPVVLTGINETARRSDLVDRTVPITLQRILPEKRRSEYELNRSLEKDGPYLFGFLLDIVSGCLREMDSIRLDNPPRMMDFSRTGEAVAKVLGMERGAFLRALSGSQQDANQEIVDASAVGEPLRAFIEERNSWVGTSRDLLSLLETAQGEETNRGKYWPKDPARFSRELRRLSPSLRLEGINLEFRVPSGRLITIKRMRKTTDITVIPGENGAVHACERQLIDDSNHVDVSVDDGDTVNEASVHQARFDAIDGDIGKKRHSPGPCKKCGGRRFWENPAREILCGICHPNSNLL